MWRMLPTVARGMSGYSSVHIKDITSMNGEVLSKKAH